MIRRPTHPTAHLRWQGAHALTTLMLALALLLTGAGLGGCADPRDSLGRIQDEGMLRVVTRNGPTTFYNLHDEPNGFEYELARRFADFLGVDLRVDADHSLESILSSLFRGNAHVAAAGLTITPERQQRLEFGPAYMDIEQYVLYRGGRPRPRSPADLLDNGSRLHVLAGSSHAEYLRALQIEYPELQWVESADLETIDLLEMLTDGEIDYTIIDSNEYIANRGFYPYLQIGFSIGQPGSLGWAVTRNADNQRLLEAMEVFFRQLRDSGELGQLVERFYSHSEDNTPIDSRTFNLNLARRLPTYQPLIEQIAEEFDLDWHLLAAIAYQESHWNPRARSPTGVRGIMMLTLPTAQEMGVTNRLDAEQSLRGGARYFRLVHRRIPAQVQEPDRTWFALAAYNVGLGHLEDARIITQRQGGDPNKWADVKERLPLLSKRAYYQHTRFGYARGSEPVVYVQNIRHYYSLLAWSDLARERTPPPQSMEQYLPENIRTALDAL